MPKTTTAIAVIGIDIGKNVFHLIGLDKHGRIQLKTKLTRGQLDARLAQRSPAEDPRLLPGDSIRVDRSAF